MFFAGSILRRVTGREGAMPAGSSVVCRPDRRKAKDSWRMAGLDGEESKTTMRLKPKGFLRAIANT
jgi:hypothetical protein